MERKPAVIEEEQMKRINWKILNYAFWTELILSYVLPFTVHGNSQYRVGFPISFLSFHNGSIGVNPLMSMHLNPLTLLVNCIIIYLMIKLGIKAYGKFPCKMQ